MSRIRASTNTAHRGQYERLDLSEFEECEEGPAEWENSTSVRLMPISHKRNSFTQNEFGIDLVFEAGQSLQKEATSYNLSSRSRCIPEAAGSRPFLLPEQLRPAVESHKIRRDAVASRSPIAAQVLKA